MANRLVDRSWPVIRRLMGAHTAVYRATRGAVGHRVPGLAPVLLLEHTGARSGKRRTSPLIYFEDGDDVVIVASKGGNPRHPGWYHNLKANPETEVQIGSERRRVRAREADEGERERLWPLAVETYGNYRDYQDRTDRKIPLMILEPR